MRYVQVYNVTITIYIIQHMSFDMYFFILMFHTPNDVGSALNVLNIALAHAAIWSPPIRPIQGENERIICSINSTLHNHESPNIAQSEGDEFLVFSWLSWTFPPVFGLNLVGVDEYFSSWSFRLGSSIPIPGKHRKHSAPRGWYMEVANCT